MQNTDKTNSTAAALHNQGPLRETKGTLKVAIDTHADFDVWVAQFDGSVPKPAQRMPRANLLAWLTNKRLEGWQVVTCYEAGPFGYGFHRKLVAAGVRNLVIRPRNWDDHHKRVRTDKTDTRSMLVALDRYLAGQTEALTVVRVPLPQEEQRRTVGRVARTLKRAMTLLAQSARGMALYYGVRILGAWYSNRRWPQVSSRLPEHLKEALDPVRRAVLALALEILAIRAQVQKGRIAGEAIPLGMGRETAEGLEQEVCDWGRFKNRRTVGSFAGLTPGESSSGMRRERGGITKCGNGRIRWLAVQAAWRLLQYQPEYNAVKKCRQRMTQGSQTALRKKRLIVALAREFLVDWWRLRTGQTTAEKLGLRMVEN